MKSYEFRSNGGSAAVALFAAAIIAATAQTRVDLRTQSRNVDFSAASSTKSSKTGTTLPPTCSVGETFLKTDAAAGRNLYACTQANTWTVQGAPDPTGNADKVLSNDGATTAWRAMGGDVTGRPDALSVSKVQGRAVSSAIPLNGQALVWNSVASQWQPQNSGAGGGASMGAQLGDFNVTQASASILTIGPNCSTATPCNVRWGNRAYSIITAATVTLTAGTGVAYIYVDAGGTLSVGHNLTLACASSCVAAPGTTAFPVNSIPIYTWTATGGIWDTTGGQDKRALLSGKILSAGTGIVTVDTGSNTNISVDPAAVALLFSPVFSGQPAIPDFTLAPHAHTNAAGGGTLDAAAIATGVFAIGRIPATATPGANAIPQAGAGGKLAMGFLASGTPNGTQFVRDDGTLAVPPGGGSTSYPGVTSDGAGGLTLTGGIQTGVGSGVATAIDFLQGTAPSAQAANTFRLRAPASIPTAYSWTAPSADVAGSIVSDGSGNLSLVDSTGAGNFVRANTPTLVTPIVGAATGTSMALSGLAQSASLKVTGIASGTQCLHADATGAVTGTGTDCGAGGGVTANILTRSFGATFGDTAGPALTAGSVVYFTVPYACTISAWNATVDAGTVTFDVWKIATGAAIPAVTNTIAASALPAIASGTAIHSATLTGWTTAVASNDIFGFQLKTVATAKYAEIDLQCNQ